MKNIKKLFLGLLLLCSLSSGAFAKDYGYFWVAGARGFYDDINMGDDKTKYLLTADRKGVPDINKIIRIEAKNRMYWDLSVGTQRTWPARAFTLGHLTHNDLAS